MTEGPVFLTGFMGAGKTRVGRILARELGRSFLDTDRMIEQRAGKTIAEIFADEGEAHFRQLERDCVLETCQRPDAVVALGGGAITRADNIEAVRCAGVLVCLKADVDTIFARVKRRSNRPLLAGLDPQAQRAKIESLLRERAPYYDQAHIELYTTQAQTPEDTAGQLLSLLESYAKN
ncbi:MAG: shikimate kinase [Gemmatimonadetes bacterium]|nr:shikimate kinase [Gemmatimonadota bacterium]MXY81496.1 shikimate kinase [Gemmatimonadota bacterium]MYB67236.1 shikimate kinase [Gemmatimonadota bacterium]